jgi:hypothetical protein
MSDDARAKSLSYQLEFLRHEAATIEEIIKRMDELTQKCKDWTILIWAGGVSLAISQEHLRQYIWLTGVMPLLFWILDGWWRKIQRTCVFRYKKISEFLNGPDLVKSFEENQLINFVVLDPRGKQYENENDYKDFTKISSTMQYMEVKLFYLGLIGLSAGLEIFFLLTM